MGSQTLEITAIITSIGGLIGSLVVLYKARSENKKNNADASKIDAEANGYKIEVVRETYKDMLETQIEAVVKPMKERIIEAENEIKDLRRRVDELEQFRGLFTSAIEYIRALCHWIDGIDCIKNIKQNKPKLPNELRKYFTEHTTAKSSIK